MENTLELVFILDRSGSMSGLEADTVGGFNSLIAKHGKEGGVLVSTVLFNHESVVLHDRRPIAEIEPLTAEDYCPAGTTALLDAVGRAIRHIRLVHRYVREEDRPGRTLFVITTDGMENASREFTADKVKALISEQKEKGWDFLFLGANIDAVESAGSIGISAACAANFHNDSRGIERNFSAVGDVMHCLRREPCAPLSCDWKADIDEDFNTRIRRIGKDGKGPKAR